MPGKRLISEQDVLDALAQGRGELAVPEQALITALAQDTARERGLRFVPASSEPPPSPGAAGPVPPRVVALGSDHGGYTYKQALAPLIGEQGWEVVDVGTDSEDSVDYPDFAYAVAHLVATGRVRRGVMIDGAGLGSAMVCNKVTGVRAACCYNEFTAWNARAHNDANVLTLGSRTLGIEVCKRILQVFLATDFEGGRHAARVAKIGDVGRRFAAR